MQSVLVRTACFSWRATRTSEPCRNKRWCEKRHFSGEGELGLWLCSCGLRLTASSGELRGAVRYGSDP